MQQATEGWTVVRTEVRISRSRRRISYSTVSQDTGGAQDEIARYCYRPDAKHDALLCAHM
jgi:hypothetical protein